MGKRKRKKEARLFVNSEDKNIAEVQKLLYQAGYLVTTQEEAGGMKEIELQIEGDIYKGYDKIKKFIKEKQEEERRR